MDGSQVLEQNSRYPEMWKIGFGILKESCSFMRSGFFQVNRIRNLVAKKHVIMKYQTILDGPECALS